jgi:hypothetical protein
VFARLYSQLAPAGCSSLTLSSLVTGSGNFSNSRSNALILGSAGANTITDTGTYNCIIGGGGTNTITGPSTDVCISGPSLNIAGPCPSPSNGVTATPSSTLYGTSGSSGGQERITIANQYSITAMTITIKVVQTTGVSYSSQSNSFPGGAVTQSSTTSGGIITYSFVLNSGQTISAGSGGIGYAQFSGTGTAHSTSGDTWSVTTTSGGTASTLTGTF